MGPKAGSEPEEDGYMGGLVAEDERDLVRGQAQPQGEGPCGGIAAAQGPGQPWTEAEGKVLLETRQAPQAAPGVDDGASWPGEGATSATGRAHILEE